MEDSSQEFNSCLSHIQGVMPCLGPLNSPLLLHTAWMQMHLWPSGASESWETIPNEAKFIRKHILYISFLLIILEPCCSPHHTMKPVFYNHPPLWSFFRPFLLFYFFCTQERIASGLSSIVTFSWIFYLKMMAVVVAESQHEHKI